MIPPWFLQGPPSLPLLHLKHRQSPPGKLTREILISSSMGNFPSGYLLINPDSLRQRFIPPSKASFMPFSFTLPNLLFKSRNCKATICSNFIWSEKESQLSPRIIVSFLSPFFWYGHWNALARLRTQSLARAYSPLNINVITPSDESWA